MGIPLDSPEEVIDFPPIDTIPDGPEDQPTPGSLLVCWIASLTSETGYSTMMFAHFLLTGRKDRPSQPTRVDFRSRSLVTLLQ
jgi:hypothetical protein